MITAIREVRRAKGLTLDDVARRCQPPTTAQTIGRLETGTRTVSMGWLNRIAAALEVDASDLVQLSERPDLPVVALLDGAAASAPTHSMKIAVPRPDAGFVGITVVAGVGDYRAGDAIWCRQLGPEDFPLALNRDVLVPRPAGRFVFGRLIGRASNALHLLPLGAGSRQQVIADPPWIAVAARLVRAL